MKKQDSYIFLNKKDKTIENWYIYIFLGEKD